MAGLGPASAWQLKEKRQVAENRLRAPSLLRKNQELRHWDKWKDSSINSGANVKRGTVKQKNEIPNPAILVVPTRESQDQAIRAIIGHAHKDLDWDNKFGLNNKPFHPLILKHGKPWYIGERTFAGRRAKRKECYMNSYMLVEDYPRLTYVEGWCWSGFLVPHAWCIDPGGQVIDPTLRQAEGYFGIPFRWDYVRETASKTGFFGVIDPINSGLLTSPVETFLHDLAC